MNRHLIWIGGFVALFLFNVVVEVFVLPALDLDNTPRNDIYFQTWWLVVITWLLVGLKLLRKLEQRHTHP